jgi:hypothetical protein
MSITAEKIVTDAMGLPPVLRAFVAEKLIESLDESDSLPLSAKWKEEIRRRCDELDSSAGHLRDADAVFKVIPITGRKDKLRTRPLHLTLHRRTVSAR